MLVVLLIFFTFWAENTDCASIFEALKTILFRNDSTELDDDAMSRIQQISALPQTSGNKTDEEEEKQWLSNKGQFVMRMPPWTKSNSSAQVFNRSMDGQVASSDFGGLDYDLEESFERMVTPPTSPDPWATGTLRSPRTGEDDDLDLAPTNPMQPEPPQITAAVDTFLIAKTAKPLTRKIYKTTTKSNHGYESAMEAKSIHKPIQRFSQSNILH
ncbi:Hypothetical predicted protein [Cloeon dipterum]|uniref:Uncharacterized protein n=1 Tax=Cloeon dipterum TaxID=197152 RepID=A0A8S1CVJ7_9INSE|nr:Hypothetical predicted protein [Cloeon dipterum]